MAAEGCCEKNCNRLGICCFIDEDAFKRKPLAELVQNDNRQCTDIPWCIFLLTVFVSQFILIGYSVGQGANPELLYRGYDYRGNICKDGYTDGPYTAWPKLTQSYNLKICVNNCDQTLKTSSNPLMIGGDYYSSKLFLSSWCIPNHPTNFTSYSTFTSTTEEYDRAIADIYTTKWLILIMSFIGIGLAFLYLRLVACIGKLLIWLTIVVVGVGGIMLSILLIQHGINQNDINENNNTGNVEIALGILIIIILIMIWLSLYFIRKRIITAIEMLDEASHSIRDIKTTLIFPVIYSIVGLLYFVFWIIVLIYIYSVQTKETGTVQDSWGLQNLPPTYIYYKFDKTMQNTIIYHFIVLFYMVQVIIYFGFMVLAGTIADWYFSDWNTEKNAKIRGYNTAELSYSPILESFHRVLRFHLGSLALGALIITFIRILRGILTYIESKTKSKQNPLIKCIFGCIRCCLICFQWIFNRVSKEGFIFTTIYGTSYCYSSYQAIRLLVNNIGRTIIVEGVSHYTELIGRLAISSLNTGLSVFIMTYLDYYSTNISSFIFPSVIIFVISYTISSLFMMVLQVAVDTIFLCFLVDETVHKQPKFASHKLSTIATTAHEQYHKMASDDDNKQTPTKRNVKQQMKLQKNDYVGV